ncbi:NADH-cytochrome b5 reductase [Mycena indigotica]|uniref:NADH-cytochrome b5 reductase n=1 Tax=Mycena indigotica TaxID=2126181 RepID=A0A8H6SW03_9AGAR|nr:NADH-cytochrome b5 reductase [Mycena indigotica]KAF7307250.1 NADH-cytochrome b5 reductase [Mycena indigotica]
MSFLRVASLRPLVCQLLSKVAFSDASFRLLALVAMRPKRRKKKSNLLPLSLALSGLGGIAAYVYLNRTIEPLPPALNPDQFITLPLKKVVPYNHNSSTFVFELPPKTSSKLPVASCLVVRATDPEALKSNGNPVVRPYTPVETKDNTNELVLLVKKYETGVMSKYMHEMKPGDTLDVKGPIPKFPYKENEFDEVALIGGGSGITPLYQVLTHALSSRFNTTKFKLLYSNVTEQDILLREELDALAKKYPSTLEVVYLLDKPGNDWKGPSGFVNADVIKKYVAPPTQQRTMVMVCGPPPQVASIAGKKAGMKQGPLGGVLKELGYTEEQVFKF